ncbi:MAG TPA: ROK family protein, partial [Bryobacteraceae bacterium]|nr:ROK family protein [Bryobacteraceae bacterium]
MKPYAVGIDVGGTKIAAGVLDRSMNLLSVYVTKEHAGQLPAQVVGAIERAYWETLKQARVSHGEIAGIGLSFAGHVDGRRGVVLTSSNMPEWDQVPLRDIVAKRLAQNVLIDNDTNLAVIAEQRYGAARGASDVVYITFSTGVGMGILVGGKLYRGCTGTAGEIGHTVVEVDGRRCSCGKRGCLMAYASGIALRNLAWERIQTGEETALRDLAWDDPQLINGELICEVA